MPLRVASTEWLGVALDDATLYFVDRNENGALQDAVGKENIGRVYFFLFATTFPPMVRE